ncbi:MAG: nucleotidyltransferase [Firmicutes bacterium]|nr:nucleotidyltransferase [Bacillota bacterium]
MEIIGIVAEYNPFHNGHIYQINEIKKKYPNSLIIVIIDNYFTQRGEISIITKEDKINLCLDNNIDIVVELPTLYATQSADCFAYNAIKILNEFNITKLCFGSESNDVDKLKTIANLQDDESFNDKVKDELDKGNSYPNALKNVLNLDFEYLPNDLLGISYIKAINKINKDIDILTIKRTNDYHDITSNDNIISAKNIRNKFINNQDISKYTPANNLLNINYDLYFKLLKYKIQTSNNLDEYLDVNEGIENRLKKYINESNTLEDYINLIKTKRYSYNKISRMLLHIFLGIKKIDNKEYNSIRILGFNSKGKEYISSLNKEFKLDNNIRTLEYNISNLYDTLTNTNTSNFELKNIPIKKD